MDLFENGVPKKPTDHHDFPIEMANLECIPDFETRPNLVLAALGQTNLNPDTQALNTDLSTPIEWRVAAIKNTTPRRPEYTHSVSNEGNLVINDKGHHPPQQHQQ